jgi:hypothetical protein
MYGWEEDLATMFVLTGDAPSIPAISVGHTGLFGEVLGLLQKRGPPNLWEVPPNPEEESPDGRFESTTFRADEGSDPSADRGSE